MTDELTPVEQDFRASWEKMLVWFQHLADSWHTDSLKDLVLLISELKNLGYDTKLRVGQSMDTFVLSRSRHHRLEFTKNAYQVRISTSNNGMTVVAKFNDRMESSFETIALNDELLALLDQLVDLPIEERQLREDSNRKLKTDD
ncbi:MAG: hypothetical protein AAFR81_21930 [Chloroflexota bacterium]